MGKQGLKVQFSSTEYCHPLSTALNSIKQKDLVTICFLSWIELCMSLIWPLRVPHRTSVTLDGWPHRSSCQHYLRSRSRSRSKSLPQAGLAGSLHHCLSIAYTSTPGFY
jgi:hypothetical protein